MAQMKEFYVDSTDGRHKLHVVRWQPDTAHPRAVLQLAHGIAEYIERYDTFARFMADNGFLVIGNDHLGHGHSFTSKDDLGFFADTDGWMAVVRDLYRIYSDAHGTYSQLPYFLLGHSMGSFLARTFLIEYPDALTGCLLSGTGNQSRALVRTGTLIARREARHLGLRGRSSLLFQLCFGTYNRRIKPARTISDWICRDEKIVDAYGEDPLCNFIPTVGLILDMFGGIRRITDLHNAQQMRKNLPVYFFAGDADPVGEYGKGVQRAYNLFLRAGLQDVTCKLYPGGRHEMLNETNKYEVFQDVLQWTQSKLFLGENTNL